MSWERRHSFYVLLPKQKIFNQKRSTNKTAGAIETFDDDENSWFKRVYMRAFLDLLQTYKSLESLNLCEIFTRQKLEIT